jgi:hypothetical protein
MQLTDDELRRALFARVRAGRLSLGGAARRIGVNTLVLEAFVSGARLPRETLLMLSKIL